MLWINEQPDQGQLFYLMFKNEQKSSNKKEIESEIKQLKKPSSKELEYKIRIIGVTDDKEKLNHFNIGFPDDKALFDGKLFKFSNKWIEDDNKYKKGDKALHSSYLYANEYTFDGSKWKFNKTLKPFHKRLNDFCYAQGKMYYEDKCVDENYLDFVNSKKHMKK